MATWLSIALLERSRPCMNAVNAMERLSLRKGRPQKEGYVTVRVPVRPGAPLQCSDSVPPPIMSAATSTPAMPQGASISSRMQPSTSSSSVKSNKVHVFSIRNNSMEDSLAQKVTDRVPSSSVNSPTRCKASTMPCLHEPLPLIALHQQRKRTRCARSTPRSPSTAST